MLRTADTTHRALETAQGRAAYPAGGKQLQLFLGQDRQAIGNITDHAAARLGGQRRAKACVMNELSFQIQI
ncbi:hypothetical protein [Burkholderia sp. 3C]